MSTTWCEGLQARNTNGADPLLSFTGEQDWVEKYEQLGCEGS